MAGQILQSSRTYTFLFTDLEGSTRLWEKYPEAMKTVMNHHDQLLKEAVEGCAGQVVKTTGDGLMAVFSSILDGVDSCIKAQQSLCHADWGEIGSLRVRMGLHVGEAQPRGDDYFGPSVNRAARLMSVAHGGQVLLSGVSASLVSDLLPEGTALRDLGDHRLKDLARPEHIFQLIHPDLVVDFPPLRSLNVRPNNLPTQPTPLIGRERELLEITNRLTRENVRLLTLTGPGGIGKTRMGLQAAAELIDRFEDGVYLVDLASVREPGTVPVVIAETLGLRETSHRDPLEELKAQLRNKKMLLVLDNFEQVTDAAPGIVELLRDCPSLKLLITSRESLHIRDEYVYPIPPLGLPGSGQKPLMIEQLTQYEAVRLFIERAQAVNPDFTVTNDNAPAVAEICVRLDGLPLAIELAAARTHMFSPQALLERLGARMNLLRGGARDLPVRQQTMRHAIDWSYDLLDQDEKHLFTLLSVFSGGGTLDAIETVATAIDTRNNTGVDYFDGLTSLVEKSLIRRFDQENGGTRFLMLETIREYSTDRLLETPEFEIAARHEHASYFANWATRQWQRLKHEPRIVVIKTFISEIENIRAAWDYWVAKRDQKQLAKFFDSLWLLYEGRGWYQAIIDLITDMLSVLSSAPSTPERIEQEIVLQTGLARALLSVRGYTAEVEQAYTRALVLSQEVGDIPQLYPVLAGLSRLYGYLSEFKKAAEMAERLLVLADRLGDDSMRAEAHLMFGYNIAFHGQVELGLAHLEKAFADYDPEHHHTRGYALGNNPGVVCLSATALILWMQGWIERAMQKSDQAVALASRLDHPYSLAYALFHNGLLHLWRRENQMAVDQSQKVLDISNEHDFLVWKSVATCLHGAGLAGLGRCEEGFLETEQGIHLYQGLNTPPTFWPMLLQLQAGVLGLMGNPGQALTVLDRALALFSPDSEDIVAAEFFRLKGVLLAAQSTSNKKEAETWLQRALRAAQKPELHTLELRTAMELHRLWLEQGNTEQGRNLLKGVYDKMVEGFTTLDLIEAREMLNSE